MVQIFSISTVHSHMINYSSKMFHVNLAFLGIEKNCYAEFRGEQVCGDVDRKVSKLVEHSRFLGGAKSGVAPKSSVSEVMLRCIISGLLSPSWIL